MPPKQIIKSHISFDSPIIGRTIQLAWTNVVTNEDTTMDSLTANEAKSQFGDMLLKAQRAPVQINKNGKPIAVVMSMDEYEGIEAMKLRLLQARVDKAKAEIQTSNTVDGNLFFEALESGQHD